MEIRKVIKWLILSIALFAISNIAITANAATKNNSFQAATVAYHRQYQKSKLTRKTKQPIRVYSTRYLKTYVTNKQTKSFYATESVKVIKTTSISYHNEGKFTTYRYVKSASGKVKGWVAASALKGKIGKTIAYHENDYTVTKAGIKHEIDLANKMLKRKNLSKLSRQSVLSQRKIALKVYHNKKASQNKIFNAYSELWQVMALVKKDGSWTMVG